MDYDYITHLFVLLSCSILDLCVSINDVKYSFIHRFQKCCIISDLCFSLLTQRMMQIGATFLEILINRSSCAVNGLVQSMGVEQC